jgi:hypothetical protein
MGRAVRDDWKRMWNDVNFTRTELAGVLVRKQLSCSAAGVISLGFAVLMQFADTNAAQAQRPPPEGVTVLGHGAGGSCGRWTTERRAGGGATHSAWALGYLSGAASALDRDLLHDTDGSGLLAWIENYCRANPLEMFHTAVQRLYENRRNR